MAGVSDAKAIVAFLNARLDEDDRAAMAAANDSRFGGRPHWLALGHGMVTDVEDQDWAVVDLTPCIEDNDVAAHIARHDPARVLREVEAKRKIIAEHKAVTKLAGLTEQELGFLGWYREWVLKNLAAVYSDHPDYRDEWKP